MLKGIPSFIGNDANSFDDIKTIPSYYKLSTSILETKILQVLLSAQVKVAMTLFEVLKRIPHL